MAQLEIVEVDRCSRCSRMQQLANIAAQIADTYRRRLEAAGLDTGNLSESSAPVPIDRRRPA